MTADDNPEGAAAEEFLWSLGVGEALPQWLKDIRNNERSMGLNQEPRRSAHVVPRPGIGPQRSWSNPEADGDTKRVPAPPAGLPTGPSTQSQKPSPAPVAPQRKEAPAAEMRTDPDDGKAYTLDALRTKYQATFSEEEILAYFRGDCQPVTTPATSGSAAAPAHALSSAAVPAPAVATRTKEEPEAVASQVPTAAVPRKFGLSIKDWLSSLDDSGFLVQYHDCIASELDSLEQIVDVYVKKDGEVDKRFFEDAGIKKLGHKRLFEKWFKDNCK